MKARFICYIFDYVQMELAFLAFESRNFLLSLTFLVVLLCLVLYQFVNDDEFGMFVEIVSFLLKIFAG